MSVKDEIRMRCEMEALITERIVAEERFRLWADIAREAPDTNTYKKATDNMLAAQKDLESIATRFREV